MTRPKTLGIVLFDKFESLDVFGPAEAYGSSRLGDAFRLVTIAQDRGSIASAQGPKALAEYGFADCPPLDIIMVSGGIGTRTEVNNAALLSWLGERAERAEIVSSVCTGAALLARAGLLDNRRATSNKRAFDWVKAQGPKVNWVAQARWVEDGKFATSSGVSAGIDMALAIIARLCGEDNAKEVAIAMEYEWHRDASWDPFAKIHGLL